MEEKFCENCGEKTTTKNPLDKFEIEASKRSKRQRKIRNLKQMDKQLSPMLPKRLKFDSGGANGGDIFTDVEQHRLFKNNFRFARIDWQSHIVNLWASYESLGKEYDKLIEGIRHYIMLYDHPNNFKWFQSSLYKYEIEGYSGW